MCGTTLSLSLSKSSSSAWSISLKTYTRKNLLQFSTEQEHGILLANKHGNHPLRRRHPVRFSLFRRGGDFCLLFKYTHASFLLSHIPLTCAWFASIHGFDPLPPTDHQKKINDVFRGVEKIKIMMAHVEISQPIRRERPTHDCLALPCLAHTHHTSFHPHTYDAAPQAQDVGKFRPKSRM